MPKVSSDNLPKYRYHRPSGQARDHPQARFLARAAQIQGEFGRVRSDHRRVACQWAATVHHGEGAAGVRSTAYCVPPTRSWHDRMMWLAGHRRIGRSPVAFRELNLGHSPWTSTGFISGEPIAPFPGTPALPGVRLSFCC